MPRYEGDDLERLIHFVAQDFKVERTPMVEVEGDSKAVDLSMILGVAEVWGESNPSSTRASWQIVDCW